VEREAHVGHHPLAQHPHAIELAEIGDPAHRGDREDQQRQRAQRCLRGDRFRRVQERQGASESAGVERTSLEHELEHRPDQPGERAGGRGEHQHRGDRRGEQAEVRPHRREKTPVFPHARDL